MSSNVNKNPNIYRNILSSIPTTIHLSSPILQNNGNIPIEYTKYGANKMIPLMWSIENKNNTLQIGSYALICVDLNVVANQWVHLYIPKIAIQKSSFNKSNLSSSQSIIGKNSFGTRGYGGPQPPKGSGVHKYVFYLFALDKSVNIDSSEENECKNVTQFINMVEEKHILLYTTLTGFYEYGMK